MRSDEIVEKLREREPELRAAGIAGVSLVGSAARRENDAHSDVDLLVRLTDDAARGGFAYFGLLDRLSQRLAAILGRDVDVITEPVRKERLRRHLDKDRTIAF